MKKVFTISVVLLSASFILSSCGNSAIKSDAKKIAELQCKSLKNMQKATSGDMSVMQESTALAAEATALAQEMEEKYTSESDKEKLQAAILEEMSKCQ